MKKLLGLAAVFTLASSLSAFAFEPNNTECIAPANPGGGWDFTCRQVGKTLQDLKLADAIVLETCGRTPTGKGGEGLWLPVADFGISKNARSPAVICHEKSMWITFIICIHPIYNFIIYITCNMNMSCLFPAHLDKRSWWCS